MNASAILALVGVLVGSVLATVAPVLQERVISKREHRIREAQRRQDRQDQRDAFQRQSLRALQYAVSDLVKAVFREQDRMLKELRRTDSWPARQWETPTATGWVDAELRLQVSRAQVFNEPLRDLASEIHEVAKKSVWASSPDEAENLGAQLEQGHQRFHDLVAKEFPNLYAVEDPIAQPSDP
jgi:hypothetical protein